jgi:hypothetical protein
MHYSSEVACQGSPLALVCVTLFFLLRSIPITSAGPQPIISKLKCTQHASIVPGPHDDASPVISTRSETKKERSGNDRSLRIEIDVAAHRTIAVSASRNTGGFTLPLVLGYRSLTEPIKPLFSVYRSVLPVYRTGFGGLENRSGSGFLNPEHSWTTRTCFNPEAPRHTMPVIFTPGCTIDSISTEFKRIIPETLSVTLLVPSGYFTRY